MCQLDTERRRIRWRLLIIKENITTIIDRQRGWREWESGSFIVALVSVVKIIDFVNTLLIITASFQYQYQDVGI